MFTELHRVNVLGEVVAIELSIRGTFLGPLTCRLAEPAGRAAAARAARSSCRCTVPGCGAAGCGAAGLALCRGPCCGAASCGSGTAPASSWRLTRMVAIAMSRASSPIPAATTNPREKPTVRA